MAEEAGVPDKEVLNERMQNTRMNSNMNGWDKVRDAVTVTWLQFKGAGAESCAPFVVDNASSWSTPLSDVETGEEIKFMFALVTTRSDDGDLKLARMCRLIQDANLHHHTYDAKSGAAYRMTRIGATRSRLDSIAEATAYEAMLNPRRTRMACEAIDVNISNPDPLKISCIHGSKSFDHLYPPHSFLSAPLNMTLDSWSREKLGGGIDATDAGDDKGAGRRQSVVTILSAIDSPTNIYEHHAAFSDESLHRLSLYKPLTPMDDVQLLSRCLQASEGCGFNPAELNSDLGDNKHCLAFLCLHDEEAKQRLYDIWIGVNASHKPGDIPIHEIQEYFGEEIGFYFAFIAHLTKGLAFLSPLGVLTEGIAHVGYHALDWGNSLFAHAAFAMVCCQCYAVLLASWRCDQARISHLWCSYGSHAAAPDRPGFFGIVSISPVSGKMIVDFPKSLRFAREALSDFVSLTMLVMVLGTVMAIFAYKAFLVEREASFRMQLVPAFLNAVQITVFGVIYQWVAERLTDYENHQTTTKHNAAMFKKLTLFYFINYYATLFYIAFIKDYAEGKCEEPVHPRFRYCALELSLQVAAVFIVNDFAWRMTSSVVLPTATRKWKERQARKDKKMDWKAMGRIERQFVQLEAYDPSRALVLDYIELYVQWGYLTLFGAACPLVLLIAMFTDWTETKTDGLKLLNDYRRVVPSRVDGIGEPLNVFFFTLYVSVPVNVGLVVYTFQGTDWFPAPFDQLHKSWVFLILNLLVFGSIDFFSRAFSELPEETAVQLQRAKVVYGKLTRAMETEEQRGRRALLPRWPPEFPYFAHAAVRVEELRAKLTDATKGWAELKGHDAFSGQNANRWKCEHKSVEASRQICVTRGYGGFVVWRGKAYFRKHGRAELLAAAEPSEEATLHVAPNIKPFKITIEGKSGAAKGKGKRNDSRPTIGRGELSRAQWLEAEGGNLAAEYDRFVKKLDDSLLALRLDFPKLVSFGAVSEEKASEEHYQVFGCSSGQWNLPHGSSLLGATEETGSGTEETARFRVMRPGCFGIVVDPSAGPPPVPPQAIIDEEDDDDDNDDEDDSGALQMSMLGRRMPFLWKGTEDKKDDAKQHVVRTITETTRVVSGMIIGKSTTGMLYPTEAEGGEEDGGDNLDEDMDGTVL